MAKQVEVREGARRQHRSIAVFGVIQCWMRNLDGLVFLRSDLMRLVGLEKIRGTRVSYIEEDFEQLFPYRKSVFHPEIKNNYLGLFASRVPFEEYLADSEATFAEQIKSLKKKKVRIDFFDIWRKPERKELRALSEGVAPFFADALNYDERFLLSYLTLLVNGQILPRDLPTVMQDEDT